MGRFYSNTKTVLIIIVVVYLRLFNRNPVLVQRLPGLLPSSSVPQCPYHYRENLIDSNI